MRISGKHEGAPGTLSVTLLIAVSGLVGNTSMVFAEAAQEEAAAEAAPQEALQEEIFPEEAMPEEPLQEEAVPEEAAPEEDSAEKALSSGLELKGALRFNYVFKSWEGEEGNRDRIGDYFFETIQIGADGHYGPVTMSMGYRFYQDYDVLHHAYVGYELSDTAQLDLGVVQAPFGLLPFASHGWFLNASYYLGLEDDYDLGLRGTFELGGLDLRLAFFKNSEGTFRGASRASTRYSYDVVPISDAEAASLGLAEARTNLETNQVNARVAYDLDHGETGSTEIGLSGRVGGLYNRTTAEYGYHWAAAAHANGRYGPLHLQLEGVAYQFRPKNPAGQSDEFVVMGAFDYPYLVASSGFLIQANAAYTLPVERGPLSAITVYNDYSVLLKTEGSYPASHQHVLGVLLQGGPIYTFFDLATGRHHPWLGPYYNTGWAAGNVDTTGALEEGPWHTRFNVNLGYYF